MSLDNKTCSNCKHFDIIKKYSGFPVCLLKKGTVSPKGSCGSWEVKGEMSGLLEMVYREERRSRNHYFRRGNL